MDPYIVLSIPVITNGGIISEIFIKLDIKNFWDACKYVHALLYGYNSMMEDILILIKEGFGSCTTKRAIIAILAKELGIPVSKMVGIYTMNEKLFTRTKCIPEKYRLPYLSMIHCFLIYKSYRVDLIEGNNNGKNHSIEEFLFTANVIPDISEKDGYLLYKSTLKDQIMNKTEMKGIKMIDVLHARTEGIDLLHSKMMVKTT